MADIQPAPEPVPLDVNKSFANTTNSDGGQNYNTANVRANPLNAFSNYTYRFSLYALKKETVAAIAQGNFRPGQESAIVAGAYMICADGGSPVGEKNQYFMKDLSIDNVSFETVVAPTSRSRGVNVVDLKFEIQEPYSAAFVPNLVQIANKITDSLDWASMYFVLRIEFYGYTDDGKVTKNDTLTKYIPFTITNFSFKVNQKGSVYSVTGVPPAHIALTAIDNMIPFHMEIKGGTVGEVFTSSAVQATANSTATARTDAAPSSAGTSTQTFVKGVKEALNNSESYQVNKVGVKTIPNQYDFRFSSEIASAVLVDPKKIKDQSIAMSNPRDSNQIAAGPAGASVLSIKENSFRAQAGTRITDLINSVIGVSDYMTKQVGGAGDSVKMWKVFPLVEPLAWDPMINMNARKVTYSVQPYKVKGVDHPAFPRKEPSTNDIIKIYDYFFTGENKDILSLELEYKNAFYDLRNAAREALVRHTNDSTGSDPNSDGPGKNTKATIDGRPFRKRIHNVYGIAQQQNTGSTTMDIDNIAVGELMAMMFDTAGDLVELDVTIVGDPDLIEQNDLLYADYMGTGGGVHSNGAMNTSQGGIYFMFNFKMPQDDYNDSTGLFNTMGTVPFTGVYFLLGVTSTFSKGKFTQKLKNSRIAWQPSIDDAGNAAAISRDNGVTATAYAEPPSSSVGGGASYAYMSGSGGSSINNALGAGIGGLTSGFFGGLFSNLG